MVANKIGESVEFEGVTYTVGAAVSVNKRSDYAGLVGKITEIATDGDMDTDNDCIDIYCDFEEPTDTEVIAKLEMSSGKVMSVLTMLTIKGLAAKHSGGRFSLK